MTEHWDTVVRSGCCAPRYGTRAPLALSHLAYDRERGQVSYTYTNPYDRCEYTEKITPFELIARLTTHIPNSWEQNNRYFGWYSNGTRGVKKRCEPVDSEQKGGGRMREVGGFRSAGFADDDESLPAEGFEQVIVFVDAETLRPGSPVTALDDRSVEEARAIAFSPSGIIYKDRSP